MKRFEHWSYSVCLSLTAASLLFSPVTAMAAPEMTDSTITDKIEDELLFDLAATSTNVDVSTSSGIVTLTGTVDNLLAKERTARIARTVKGVRSVVNRLKVKPYIFKSDEDVKSAVSKALPSPPAPTANCCWRGGLFLLSRRAVWHVACVVYQQTRR